VPLWIGYALLAAFFAALVAIFGKVGIREVDATLATAVRAVVMAAFLVTVAVALGKTGSLGGISRRSFVFIVLSGVAGAASWLCYFIALRDGPATGVAALDRLSVVIVFALAVVFLGDAFTMKAALGAALVVTGAILLT
jgi:bacterial/archaeal transporter family protein